MSWHVIHLADVAPTPWKNGGGTTRELVAWPDAEHWVWRMSRWIAVLGGAGLALTHNGQRHALTVDSAPFCFDGGAPTGCELINGVTQDFNLMARLAGDVGEAGEAGVAGVAGDVGEAGGPCQAGDAWASARVSRVQGNASWLLNTIKTIAIYAIHTGARVCFNGENMPISPGSLAWRTVAAQDVIQIDAEDALLIEIDVQPAGVVHSLKDMVTGAATHISTHLSNHAPTPVPVHSGSMP